MLTSTKKNGTRPGPRATSGVSARDRRSEVSSPPDTEVVERPQRRRFTAEYKQRILRGADAALASGVEGALGALLRQEGLYSSHLATWRRARDQGELAGLTPKKRGRKPTARNPLADEVERLQRRNAQLEQELEKAKVVIYVQKKVAALLGNPIPDDTTEDK
jgi:transposase